MAHEENLRPYDSERARENQPKSVESRLKNKAKKQTIAAATEAVLNTPVTDPNHLATIQKAGLPVTNPTYRDFMVASIVLRTIQKGRADDLLKLQAVIGEAPEQAESGQTEALHSIIDAIRGDENAD